MRNQALFIKKNPFRYELHVLIMACGLAMIGLVTTSFWQFPVLMAVAWLRLMFICRGNFNGGSDNMTFVILTGIVLGKVKGEPTGLTYVALLSVSSYLFAGWVKVLTPEWMNGVALHGFLRLSPLQLSSWEEKKLSPKITPILSRGFLFIECTFPFALFNPWLTYGYVGAAVLFHLLNARWLGLNRFFWVWISTFPALIWFSSE